MSKGAIWDYYLGIAGRNSVYQYPSAGCCKPLSSPPLQSDSPWSSPVVPLQSLWGKIRSGAAKKSWMCTLVFVFHQRNRTLRGDLSAWCCTGLGERQCHQHVAAPLIFLAQSFLFSVVQGGALAPPPCSRIFSVLSFPWIVISCSCEGEHSWEWPLSQSWWHHSWIFNLLFD